jgi:hypothetical protein
MLPASSSYTRVAAASSEIPEEEPGRYVDELDRTPLVLESQSVDDRTATEKWTSTYGVMDSQYATVGGREVQVVGPDRVKQDWIDEGGYLIDDYACPLVVAFDEQRVRFDAAPASFDFGGTHECRNTDWPTAATPWLVLDRDGNSSIDGGHELFGTGTQRDGGFASHGFEALAELDDDGDGHITPKDPAWASLRLWRDIDRNRTSSPEELVTLDSEGLTSLALDYETKFECTDSGNCEGQRAQVQRTRGSAQLVDVYLRCR